MNRKWPMPNTDVLLEEYTLDGLIKLANVQNHVNYYKIHEFRPLMDDSNIIAIRYFDITAPSTQYTAQFNLAEDIKPGDILAIPLTRKNANPSIKINRNLTTYDKFELVDDVKLKYLVKTIINKNNHKKLYVDYIIQKYDTTVHTNQFRIHIQLYANSIDKLEELY